MLTNRRFRDKKATEFEGHGAEFFDIFSSCLRLLGIKKSAPFDFLFAYVTI